VAIAVPDLEQALEFMTQTVGLEVTQRMDAPQHGVRVAFVAVGDAALELIEPTTDETRAQRLGAEGTARIEHLALAVDDVGAVFGGWQAKGVEFTTAKPDERRGNLTAFTEPESSLGIALQLIGAAPAAT